MIQDLDQHKKEALKAIWATVNREFGNIFSTLLPGTMAKLEEPEGMTFLQGGGQLRPGPAACWLSRASTVLLLVH